MWIVHNSLKPGSFLTRVTTPNLVALGQTMIASGCPNNLGNVFLFRRLSVALQRVNAACFLNTVNTKWQAVVSCSVPIKPATSCLWDDVKI